MALSTVCFLAIALFAAAQPALSRPEGPQTPDFNQMLKEFQTNVEKSMADIKKTINLPESPSGDDVVKAMKDQRAKMEKSLTDMKSKIEESIKKNPEISGALKSMEDKINEAKEKLKKENPEVAANVQKAADGLKGAYDTLTSEFGKMKDKLGNDEAMQKLMKDMIDSGNAGVKDLQAKFQEITKQKA